jgi:collagenase-like PrtC family protease
VRTPSALPPPLTAQGSQLTAVELLAPARDPECGRAAIDCGADAVYIGAPRFGARAAAGNPVEDIAALVAHAHPFHARVYVTLNTLLHDDELPDAVRLAGQLRDVGIDGLIVQDAGLLECDLPPLPLIASTQMDNRTPERVAFLERVGFQRAILARELSLEEIREIRKAAPRIELECFVHGSLCVGFSGQCRLSYALGGRSGNRGECAQPCRKPYAVVDAQGRTALPRAHHLSLRDLDLSAHYAELLDAGVSSFKIEGRLKDRAYVANVVAHHRAKLDEALRGTTLRRSSSGTSTPGFAPDPTKTFHRGSTTYFLLGRDDDVARPSTPKMLGEEVGRVTALEGTTIAAETSRALHAGDGLCFFDERSELRGTQLNAVRGGRLEVRNAEGLRAGTTLYRNRDHQFLAALAGARTERRIAVTFTLGTGPDGLELSARDEDGISARRPAGGVPEAARDPAAAEATIRRQLARTGDSSFACTAVEIDVSPIPFLAMSALNALRRNVLAALTVAREERRPRPTGGIVPNDAPFPSRELDWRGNVLNAKAEAFYRRHGVERLEWTAESGLEMRGRAVMTCRYCLGRALGRCPDREPGVRLAEPLFLVDDEGHRLRLVFDCARCVMELVVE